MLLDPLPNSSEKGVKGLLPRVYTKGSAQDVAKALPQMVFIPEFHGRESAFRLRAELVANVKKEQGFHESDLSFRVRVKAKGKKKTVEFTVKAKDNAAKKFKEALADADETLSVEWTHRHYVQDDEYIPHGEDIAAFLKREIAKPIIRWAETKKDGKTILGYEILPNKYFYHYQPPTPAKELLAEFWKLETEAEKMLAGLAR